eukprot:13643117-Ditylum_brightwellii.AAC.1
MAMLIRMKMLLSMVFLLRVMLPRVMLPRAVVPRKCCVSAEGGGPGKNACRKRSSQGHKGKKRRIIESSSDSDEEEEDDDESSASALVKHKNADVSDNKKTVESVKMSSKKSSTLKKGKSKKSKSAKEEQDEDSDASSDDSGICNIAYDAMDGKVEKVLSNSRIFAELAMKGKKKRKKLLFQFVQYVKQIHAPRNA